MCLWQALKRRVSLGNYAVVIGAVMRAESPKTTLRDDSEWQFLAQLKNALFSFCALVNYVHVTQHARPLRNGSAEVGIYTGRQLIKAPGFTLKQGGQDVCVHPHSYLKLPAALLFSFINIHQWSTRVISLPLNWPFSSDRSLLPPAFHNHPPPSARSNIQFPLCYPSRLVGGIMERNTAGVEERTRTHTHTQQRFCGTLIRIHMSSSLRPTGMWRWWSSSNVSLIFVDNLWPWVLFFGIYLYNWPSEKTYRLNVIS